jgi:DNA-binding transcriptional ArsR family regulator
MRDARVKPPCSEPATALVDWVALVPYLIHPTKVLIIEAMLWINRPLSASELEKAFGGSLGVSTISYHVRTLASLGILERVAKVEVRGAWKRVYRLAEPGP